MYIFGCSVAADICSTHYIVIPNLPFWYASAAYQASSVEPWFIFWRDAVQPKYPWRDQMSLICHRSVPKGTIRYLPYPNSHVGNSNSIVSVWLFKYLSTQLASVLQFSFGGKDFLRLLSTAKYQLNLKLRVVCLLAKPLWSLYYGNTTLLESDHDIVGYQVSDKGAYHLAKKYGNFGLKSNGKVIFRKFRSEIVKYLQMYFFFPFGTERRKFPYHLVNFPVSSLSSAENRITNGKRYLVRLVCWFWKTLTIIQMSSQPVYSDKW